MPGVPSGRGCDACRKQKKKCDATMPSCSRCARLGIACVGSGHRRYKFMDQTGALATLGRSGLDNRGSGDPPSASPSNDLTVLTSRFLSALSVTDIGYDLTIYGAFFNDVPRRLGRNEALDASVRALVTALPSLHSHQQSPEMFKTYAAALSCLRNCLDNPANGVTPDTLCAVYLIMICQGWLGRYGDLAPSHGEAIAYMLNVAAEQNWQGTFEIDMTKTLCTIVTMESIANARIKLDPRLWTVSESLGPRTPVEDATNIEFSKLRNLVRIPKFARDVRSHLAEIQSSYHVVRSDCAKMAAIVSAVPTITSPDGTPTTQHLPVSVRRLHVRQQTIYGILLSLAIMLNYTLLLLTKDSIPSSLRTALEVESAAFVDEVIALARQAAQYRPLGSSSTPLFLITAWIVTGEAGRQRRIEELIVEYQEDFSSTNWLDVALSVKPRLSLL